MAQLTDAELKDVFEERLKDLPQVVRDAITSVDIKKQLQDLSNKHKLHLDQWQLLENEVMLTLLGLEAPENLKENIMKQVGLSDEIASELSANISRIVFEPIRQELERELEHPEAKAAQLTGEEQARREILSQHAETQGRPGAQPVAGSLKPEGQPVARSQEPVATQQEEATSYKPQATSPVVPATPPNPPPVEKAVRAPTSSAYKSGETSTARKDVHNDPYRESPQ